MAGEINTGMAETMITEFISMRNVSEKISIIICLSGMVFYIRWKLDKIIHGLKEPEIPSGILRNGNHGTL